MKPSRDLTEIIGVLKRSPLSQLSLSSRELFHSNFLAWLCDNYRSMGGALFRGFLREGSDKIEEVAREKKNIDLWLRFTNGEQLIIENKVKSIPTMSQLEEYSKKVGSDRTSFLLLSLSRPSFLHPSKNFCDDRNGARWHCLNYAELASLLRDALSKSNEKNLAPGFYDRQILDDYIKYVEALNDLYSHYSIDASSTDSPFFLDNESSFDQDRFFFGVVKMRYAQLAGMLNQELEGKFKALYDDERSFWTGCSGSVFAQSGMTRGTGLLDFKYMLFERNETPNDTPLALGVQLQDNQFRLVVARRNTSAEQAAKILADDATGKRLWFDFSHLILEGSEYPVNGKFNKYGEIFYYRYKRLGRDLSPSAIVGAIVTYAEIARDNAQALRETLMSTLHSDS